MSPSRYESSEYIAVINTAFLGDLILTIPFLQQLKRENPSVKIVLFCRKGVVNFINFFNLCSDVIELEKGNSKSYRKAIVQVSNIQFSKLYCLHRSIRSYFFSLQLKAKNRFGFSQWFNYFGYSDRVPHIRKLPEALRLMMMLDYGKKNKISWLKTDWNQIKDYGCLPQVPSDLKWNFTELVGQNGKINHKEQVQPTVAIFPGSVWNTKRWPTNKYAELVENLVMKNYKIKLMGGPGESKYGDEIMDWILRSKKLSIEQITDLIENCIEKLSILGSFQALYDIDLVVANDSASAHLAALINKPIVVFFGPTVLEFGYRPWSDHVYVFQTENLKCRPCGSHGHNKCPIGTHECMEKINVQGVVKTISMILTRVKK